MPEIAPPPDGTTSGDDRDQQACEALVPGIVAFFDEAVAAGWHETEIIAVFIGFALTRAVEGAGFEAAQEFLSAAQERLRRGMAGRR